LLLGALILVGQATGAAALRRAVGADAVSIDTALKAGIRDLLIHPLRRLGLALATTLADLLALGLALALLRVLWAPISVELAAGQLVSPQALLLLVGFVAIWLALVLVFGALHAWVSTLWSLELAADIGDARRDAEEVHP
jgi:hypothetical protein